MKRRDFLKLTSAGVCGLAITSCAPGGGSNKGVTQNTGQFTEPFFVPPELKGTMVNGRKVFNLEMRTGTKQFTGQGITKTMGINGDYLAPTLRMVKGDLVDLNVTNQLGQDTTLHWHGMRVPSEMDGGPHQIITHNTTWQAAYTVNQQASTNWYHPHVHGETASQVYAGLAGMLIVDDAESLALDLPKTYGVDDFPVVVQDREMTADGTFSYAVTHQEINQGKKGNTYLINGVIEANLDVEAKEIRFRLLNGSNSRIYKFAISGGLSFQQIATEQSFLDTPKTLQNITMSPGERAEIVVDFSNHEGSVFSLQDLNSGVNLFQINVGKAGMVTKTPSILTTLTHLTAAQAVKTRPFVLSMGMGNVYINGKQMDEARIDETMLLDQIEILDIKNTSNMDHNFHIHGAYFTILSRNGGSPAAYESGFKDTVYLPPNSNVQVVVQFEVATTANAPFMYHCHILEHEDAGMMGQFTVV